MELEKFVQGALVSIVKGVKSANTEVAREDGNPVFSIKHSGWYDDHATACVKFKAIVKANGDVLQILDESKQDQKQDACELNFNISHAYGIN